MWDDQPAVSRLDSVSLHAYAEHAVQGPAMITLAADHWADS